MLGAMWTSEHLHSKKAPPEAAMASGGVSICLPKKQT